MDTYEKIKMLASDRKKWRAHVNLLTQKTTTDDDETIRVSRHVFAQRNHFTFRLK